MTLKLTALSRALILTQAVVLGGLSLNAQAADCDSVNLADPGWSDSNVTTTTTKLLLDSLGYDAKVTMLSVPVSYESLANGQMDAFLGNWMPAQQKFHDKYVASGKVEELSKNLHGTEFTLAVPKYVYDGGVKTFDDLAKHKDEFGEKLYGIEPGAPANQSLQTMIDNNEYGLGGWSLVESGEQAMLSEVKRAVQRKKAIVFLGWTPHPMNVNFDLAYLSGGDKYFGSTGDVFTLTRKGLKESCPNVTQLLSNMAFTLKMENTVMTQVLEQNADVNDAVKAWIKANPDSLDTWLKGVTTKDGASGEEAVKKALL
ncbi:choline ABC transporter substrate-binding protein [Pokkaliibacter sp. CJK22405]|uniref:choline ABC transporter substrate-binding protein n=1 Tax=Pokkaliibacter sp. CJK22405 TaxID=3384615 RepID=UPI003985267C